MRTLLILCLLLICGNIHSFSDSSLGIDFLTNILSKIKGIEFNFGEFRIHDGEAENFVTGFFEGVSEVPIEKNKCYKDISIIKGDIILAFKEVLNAIMNNRSEIISSLTKVVDLLMEHKDISSYCRFGKLGISIGFLYSKLSLTYTYNIYK
jgi:hypothetical protein